MTVRSAAAWLRGHLREITALTATTTLALTTTPWLWLLPGAFAAAWVIQEIRDHHYRRTLATTPPTTRDDATNREEASA